MATLPDLDTNVLGPVGWWNALEHGADFLDVGEATEYVGVESFTAYDNGIEGGLSRHPALKYRVKTDGWIVVYFDTTEGGFNPEDFLSSFHAANSPGLTQTALSEEVNALRSVLSNADEMDFSHADVGLFNYRYPDLHRYVLLNGQGSYAFSGEQPYAYVCHAGAEFDDDHVEFDGEHILTGVYRWAYTLERFVEDGTVSTPGYFYTLNYYGPYGNSCNALSLVLEAGS